MKTLRVVLVLALVVGVIGGYGGMDVEASSAVTIGVGLEGRISNTLHGSWCNYSAWDLAGSRYTDEWEYKLVGTRPGTGWLWGYVQTAYTRSLYNSEGQYVGEEGILTLVIDYYCSDYGGFLEVATLRFFHLKPGSYPSAGTYIYYVPGSDYTSAPTIGRPINMAGHYPVYRDQNAQNMVSTGPHLHVEIHALHNNFSVTYPSLQKNQQVSFGDTLYTFTR